MRDAGPPPRPAAIRTPADGRNRLRTALQIYNPTTSPAAAWHNFPPGRAAIAATIEASRAIFFGQRQRLRPQRGFVFEPFSGQQRLHDQRLQIAVALPRCMRIVLETPHAADDGHDIAKAAWLGAVGFECLPDLALVFKPALLDQALDAPLECVSVELLDQFGIHGTVLVAHPPNADYTKCGRHVTAAFCGRSPSDHSTDRKPLNSPERRPRSFRI